MAPDAAVVFEDERLKITCQPGSTGLYVVSFAGVGLALGGVQPAEFRRSVAASLGAEAGVIYVIDKRRSWYGDGVDRQVETVVNATLRAEGAQRVVTLGNSMGGFGAIVFARRLHRCDGAIAFSAQSSVDRTIAPFETRYDQWTSGVSGWSEPDAAQTLDPACRYTLVFGLQDETDRLHAERFRARAHARTDIRLEAEAGHQVAAWLREKARLYPLLHELFMSTV